MGRGFEPLRGHKDAAKSCILFLYPHPQRLIGEQELGACAKKDSSGTSATASAQNPLQPRALPRRSASASPPNRTTARCARSPSVRPQVPLTSPSLPLTPYLSQRLLFLTILAIFAIFFHKNLFFRKNIVTLRCLSTTVVNNLSTINK